MSDLVLDRSFDPVYGQAVEVAPGVRRLTARNPGPFTFHGTNSYIVGHGRVAVIDPGPDPNHAETLIAATKGETVTHILVTHTHRDHVTAARRLQALTGATTLAAGSHRLARAPLPGETAMLDAAADTAFAPDITLADGAVVDGDGWRLTAVATPGHTVNHLSFVLAATDILFSGDHVMAWSTTIVAPPDGAMADYMDSLDRLLARPEHRYLPGHGGPVADAQNYVRALKRHRQMREAAILAELSRGPHTIPDLVAAIYRDTDPSLHAAAGLSVLAHLEDLLAQRRVANAGAPGLAGFYRLA
jgi:glyoxylase-like metal-dependent hydrolase (beta-lactamase superfamily II)